MFHCDRCRSLLKLVGEVKDNEKNIILVYTCPNCHNTKYVKK